jgi:hypothetical protein
VEIGTGATELGGIVMDTWALVGLCYPLIGGSAKIRGHLKIKKRKGGAKTESVVIDFTFEKTEECISRSN